MIDEDRYCKLCDDYHEDLKRPPAGFPDRSEGPLEIVSTVFEISGSLSTGREGLQDFVPVPLANVADAIKWPDS